MNMKMCYLKKKYYQKINDINVSKTGVSTLEPHIAVVRWTLYRPSAVGYSETLLYGKTNTTLKDDTLCIKICNVVG